MLLEQGLLLWLDFSAAVIQRAVNLGVWKPAVKQPLAPLRRCGKACHFSGDPPMNAGTPGGHAKKVAAWVLQRSQRLGFRLERSYLVQVFPLC